MISVEMKKKKRVTFSSMLEYNLRNAELSAYVRDHANDGGITQWYAPPDFEDRQRKIREHNEKSPPEEQVPYTPGIWMDVTEKYEDGHTALEKARMIEIDIKI